MTYFRALVLLIDLKVSVGNSSKGSNTWIIITSLPTKCLLGIGNTCVNAYFTRVHIGGGLLGRAFSNQRSLLANSRSRRCAFRGKTVRSICWSVSNSNLLSLKWRHRYAKWEEVSVFFLFYSVKRWELSDSAEKLWSPFAIHYVFELPELFWCWPLNDNYKSRFNFVNADLNFILLWRNSINVFRSYFFARWIQLFFLNDWGR